MIKEKSCGAVIFNINNEVLVIKHNQGHWSFPKGHVEGNEIEVETAIREVKEETNLDVQIDSDIRVVSTYSPKDGVIKDVVFFLGTTRDIDVKLQMSEVCEYKWLLYEDAIKILTYDDDRFVLRKIFLKYSSCNN